MTKTTLKILVFKNHKGHKPNWSTMYCQHFLCHMNACFKHYQTGPHLLQRGSGTTTSRETMHKGFRKSVKQEEFEKTGGGGIQKVDALSSIGHLFHASDTYIKHIQSSHD